MSEKNANQQLESNKVSLEGDKKECRYCSTLMPVAASVCYHCKQNQTWWKNHFRIDHVSLFIALVMMIIAYQQLQEARNERIAAKNAMEKADQAKRAVEGMSKDMGNMALETRRIFGDLTQKNILADEKLKGIDYTLQKASKSVSELKSISEFSVTVLDAQNDDRNAFDKLDAWAQDKSYSFSSRAREAWITIIDAHSSPMYLSNLSIPWSQGVDPSKFKITDLTKIYESAPPYMKPAFIEYIWKREDFSKKDRMKFLFDIIQRDKSLKAVEYAGRYFCMGAQLNVKPLAIDLLTKWWEENKAKIK